MFESQFIPQIKLYIQYKDTSRNHTLHKNTLSVKNVEYLKAKSGII